MMLPNDLVRLAFQNLSLHKVRSALTSLGVIFGVGSVIAMLAVSEGAKNKALEQIAAMGIDKIILSTRKPSKETEDTNKNNNSARNKEQTLGLSSVDLRNVRKMDNVSTVVPVSDLRQKVLKGIRELDVRFVGVERGFLNESGSEMVLGRWFAPSDFASNAQVCVIGSNVKRKMFSLSSKGVIGNDIKINNQPYRVIGVLNNIIGTEYGEIGSPNDMIFIPWTLGKGLFKSLNLEPGQVEYDVFIVKVENLAYIDNTARRLSAYFKQTHSDKNDWGIVVPHELLKQREETQNIFTIVMGSIAGISLIVGGIGIMNIMLAGVYERRKEIGTRRALGAQKSDILWQFLLETVFLTTLGGVLGVAVGVGLSKIISAYAGMPVLYSWWSIVLSLLISSFVGIVFGTYPAWKAAQQNPIDVLRSE